MGTHNLVEVRQTFGVEDFLELGDSPSSIPLGERLGVGLFSRRGFSS